jgi:thioredoxin 1
MSTEVMIVNNDNFEQEVIQSSTLALVDFYADWCGPCKQIAPTLTEIANELAGKVKVVKVNVDNDPELAEKYGVRGIPTLVLMLKGDIKKTMVGMKPKEDIIDAINNATKA